MPSPNARIHSRIQPFKLTPSSTFWSSCPISMCGLPIGSPWTLSRAPIDAATNPAETFRHSSYHHVLYLILPLLHATCSNLSLYAAVSLSEVISLQRRSCSRWASWIYGMRSHSRHVSVIREPDDRPSRWHGVVIRHCWSARRAINNGPGFDACTSDLSSVWRVARCRRVDKSRDTATRQMEAVRPTVGSTVGSASPVADDRVVGQAAGQCSR